MGRAQPKDDAQEAEDWVDQELGAVKLGDERLNRRLQDTVRALGNRPQASFPKALDARAPLQGAYRLFDNARVNPEHILAPHIVSTLDRLRDQPVILGVQDTTFIDYSGHRHSEGLGPLHQKGGWGLLCHATLAFTPEGAPLGVLGMRVWARDPDQPGRKRTRHSRPIEDKESHKWIDGMQALARLREELPEARLVSVADREGDVFEFFRQARELGVDLLVRAAWDRRVLGEQEHLWATLEQAPVLGCARVTLPARPRRPSRVAKLSLRTCQVDLKPPHGSAESVQPFGLWALWAYEKHPPVDAEPIEWMLLTTVPITSLDEARERLQWYSRRWGIEVWHKTLKSGCKIESRQLESFDQLHRLLVVYGIIAWRILYMTLLSRLIPDMPASAILAPEEWQALYCRIHRTPTPPQTAPPLRQAVRWIASLGGFLGRKGDGEPGVQTLWSGFQELITLTDMYRIMNPQYSANAKDVRND